MGGLTRRCGIPRGHYSLEMFPALFARDGQLVHPAMELELGGISEGSTTDLAWMSHKVCTHLLLPVLEVVKRQTGKLVVLRAHRQKLDV